MPYLSLVFVSTLWGTSFLFISVAARTIDPLGIAAGRVTIAAIVLVTVTVLRGARWPRTPRLWAKLALLAIIGQILPFVLLGIAARFTASVDLALTMGAIPLVVFVAGRFVPPTEAWNRTTALGLAIGFLGVAMALATPVELGGATVWLGRGAALLAAIGYGLAALVSRNLSRDLGTTTVVTASMAISTAVLLPAWLVLHPALAAASASAEAIAALGVLGLANTALAYVVYFRLIETAGATFAGMNNYLVPPLGLVCGAAVLGERVPPAALAGLVAILAGIVLVRRGRNGRIVTTPPRKN